MAKKKKKEGYLENNPSSRKSKARKDALEAAEKVKERLKGKKMKKIDHRKWVYI